MALIKGKQIQNIDASKVNDSSSKRFVSDVEKANWNAKYDAELVAPGTDGSHVNGGVDGLMSSQDKFILDNAKTKLDGIEEGALNNPHPSTHDATMINETTELQFASQDEKDAWADKYTQSQVDQMLSDMEAGLEWQESVASFSEIGSIYGTESEKITPSVGYVVSVDDEAGQTYRFDGTDWVKFLSMGYTKATQSVDGLMSSEDKTILDNAKTKLDTVEEGALNNPHPATHPSSMIDDSGSTTKKFVTDAQITEWSNKAETTTATDVSDGLMSSDDKAKLDSDVSRTEEITFTIVNAQRTINTDIGLNVDDFTHRTNIASGALFVNGFKQTKNTDFDIVVTSDELVINWKDTDFQLEGDDVVTFTFTKVLY